ISDWPISESTSLKKLIIPNSNTKLGKSKFSLCKSLEEVQIGSFVKSLSTSMFESDTKLKTVNFTKEFLAQKPFIGSRAFAKCTSLRNLVLPNGISGIADDALADAKNLETVSCGKDIEEFGIYNNVNLKKITLNCKKAKTRLYFNNFGWEGVNHNPETFNYKPVIVECYSGTEAEYYVNNVYPYWKGYEDDFKFVSLGQCEGTPYSHPTTAPPTTTAPYTVSVGEGDEWYLAGTFNDYTRDDSTKLIYNPTSKTLEKEVVLDKGEYEFVVCDINTSHRFNLIKGGILGDNNCPDPSKFSIATDNSTVKFVFDGIKVKMYINEQGVTSTTVPTTTTSTTVPSTTTTNTSVSSTSVTTSTTVPDTSVSETASVPSTPTIPTVTAGTLNLEKTNDSLFVGKSREYKYTSSCNDPINYVKFVSSDNTIAQVNLNLNKDNTFTVVPLTKGTATITATLYDRNNREVTKSTFTVTVKQPVTKITIKANNKVVNNNVINIKKVNGRAKLNVSVAPANADDKRVTYKSSDTSVATVNSKGLITAKKIGYTTITIASNDGNVKTTVKVTVGDTATSIKIPSARFITTVNSKAKLNPTIY
ncbi:MAG: leucine-rich repeat protein, partial [Ruminococcus sp.]|nr:leucine-rich repeat protein [Ruminococcus sp.]